MHLSMISKGNSTSKYRKCPNNIIESFGCRVHFDFSIEIMNDNFLIFKYLLDTTHAFIGHWKFKCNEPVVIVKNAESSKSPFAAAHFLGCPLQIDMCNLFIKIDLEQINF